MRVENLALKLGPFSLNLQIWIFQSSDFIISYQVKNSVMISVHYMKNPTETTRGFFC